MCSNGSAPELMRAVRYDAFGHPNDVLELRSDVPVPQCGKNDVLVEVQAAALNPVDYKILKGNFKMVKALMTPAPGFDFAGRVVAVGTHCKRLAVGDLVHGMCSFRRTGTLAEFIAVPEKVAAKRPKSLGLYDAAGLPLAGLTAYCSLSKYLRPESRVLVLGGASATGSAALQVARMFKAGFVATTCSPRSEEYVKSLGADMTVNYREENVWTVMQEKALQFDVIFDTIDDAVPGDTYRGAVPGGVLANGGHLVTITGDQQGHFSLGEVMKRGWQLTARNFECKTKHKGAGYHQYTQTEGNATALEQLTAAGVTLKVDPHIFALHDAKAAFVHLMSGQARGKVVISIRDHADSPKASPAAAAGEGEAGKSAQ